MAKFKVYNQNQPMLIPPNVRDCIPQDHICFVISDTVDQMNLTVIEDTYADKGASAYSPRMMLKVLFYAYNQGIRGSRKIEAKLYEDNVFRFLAGSQQPDHGTINLFRKEHLKDIESVFTQIVLLCEGLGMIDSSDVSTDGSKFKANASRHNTHSQEELSKLKKRIKESLEQAERIDQEEDRKYGKKRGYNQMPEKLVDPETRRKEIERLKQKLLKIDGAQEAIKKKQRKARNNEERKLCKNATHNLTDADANLMPMKTNRSFQPAYNGQIATNQQVILSYDLTKDATDTNSLLPMINKTESVTNKKVKIAKADSAYFSEDNMNEIKKKKIDAYIPDQKKVKEEQHAKKGKKIPKYDRRNFKYDSKKDEIVCPQGKRLRFLNYDASKKASKYACSDCTGCPGKTICTKGNNRYMFIKHVLEEHKKEMRTKLNSVKGKRKYLERMSDVEPVFGNIKYNQGFNEFSCRGKPMALIEFGLVCTAHNFTKIFKWLKKTDSRQPRTQLNSLVRLKIAA